MIQNLDDLAPAVLRQELLRLGRLDPNWVKWTPLNDGKQSYAATSTAATWVKKLWKSGADAFSMWGLSVWLAEGPKVFRPTPAQCEAMENIEVKLTLEEYAQPYPALLVELPRQEQRRWIDGDGVIQTAPGTNYGPFLSVLCFRSEHLVSCTLHSVNHENDITTTIAVDGRPMEISIQKYDEDVIGLASGAARALRVAINSCLALVNYGCHKGYLFPKQAENDQRLAGEQSERGRRARERLKLAIKQVSFDQEIVLHDTDHRQRDPNTEPTGREVSTHWRKGHWAMQAHGPAHSLRKRILRKPVMVRADKLLVDTAATSAVYR